MVFKVIPLCLMVVGAFASYIPEPYHEIPAKYDFNYGVKDDYSGNDFGHQEIRDGYTTSGEYRVALPDGRVQVVTYTADKNGYVAQVTYEGEATYPDHKPYKQEPAPYKPEPYHHEPAPYHPEPAPYKPAPYHPEPAPYKPAPYKPHHPAPYHPHPAPYHPHPAPYHPHPAPYHPQPAPYHPQPAPYHPQPAPYPAKPEVAEEAAEETAEEVTEESTE